MTAEGPIPGKSFDQWLADVMPEISQAQAMLEEALSSDPKDLAVQANMYEDTYSRMTEIMSQANAWLDHSEYVGLLRIDKDLTVQRQAAELKFNTMRERMLRDRLKGLCQAISSRMRRAQWRS